MKPERIAALVLRWAWLYTRNLPEPAGGDRVAEIEADLHDHIADARAAGAGDRHIAREIASRALRGAPADLSWRAQARARPTAKGAGMHRPARRSAVRVALVTAGVLAIPLTGMAVSDEVRWSAADFVFAAVLLAGTGALLELALRRPRNLVLRLAAVAIGVASVALGEADDAPGLVLFGLLAIAAAVALTLRRRVRPDPRSG